MMLPIMDVVNGTAATLEQATATLLGLEALVADALAPLNTATSVECGRLEKELAAVRGSVKGAAASLRELLESSRPEAAAIGAFNPIPFDADLHGASTATMLAQALAPLAADELLPGGIIQAADELAVLTDAIDSARGGTAKGKTMLYAIACGIERRLRLLAVIASRTLAPLEEGKIG